jgi:asparagine synthase (glutamine-hydrolysing)
MLGTLRHRGPDDCGESVFPSARLGLGHTRLSIIDLTRAGHQPMADILGHCIIVFNGEIYNYRDLRQKLEGLGHRFRSQSDTETIIEAYRAWGIDCIKHFNGMFAFALYDSQIRRLFMARDRAGEKPLFYSYTNGRFSFASELKSLMSMPEFQRRLNITSLEFYLAYGYVPNDRCILQGVRKLPPAHALTLEIETGNLNVWRYWQLPDPAPREEASEEELVRELEGLLEDAVRRQLVADVPVGILLSGGVDSSLVTALAARVSSKPINTFTVTLPGNGSYDEGPYARLIASHFGTKHMEIEAEPVSMELLPKLAHQFDEPMCDSSMIPMYLVSSLIRRYTKVAVGGDGGDELFGGYLTYNWIHQQIRARRWIPKVICNSIKAGAENLLPLGFLGRNFLIGLANGMDNAISSQRTLFDPLARRRLLAPIRDLLPDSSDSPEFFKASLCDANRGFPGMVMAVDFHTYLPEDILVKVDRASMLMSLEVRAPFLDYRIIEFAFRSVPNRLRATTSERKILLRRLAAHILPKGFNLERKQGFSLPLQEWFKGEWGRYIENILFSVTPGLFDTDFIRKVLREQRLGACNTERLFALALFELWRREYRISL